MNKKQIIVMLSAFVALSVSTTSYAEWSIKTLDGLGGGSSFARSINDLGQVTGSADLPGNIMHAFITGPNGVNTFDLGSLGSGNSVGADINAYGQVTGGFTTPNGFVHPMITGPNGVGMRDLGTLGGLEAWATGINDFGRVVGNSYTADGYPHAFITGPNGEGMIDLGTLEGGYTSDAADINNLGQVVGTSAINIHGFYHAFITGPDGVGMTDIGILPGFWGSLGRGLNASGNVIGDLLLPTPEGDYRQAFVTGPNGIGMTTLGTLGGKYAFPTDINDAGQIVGVSTLESGVQHSFLFIDDGMVDLSVLDVVVSAGWIDLIATGINNNGQIVGFGKLSDDPSHLHSFLLSFTPDTVFNPNPIFRPELPDIPIPQPPVPEPQTYAMLLAGLGLVGLMRRRPRVHLA
ncbi:MAG: hypothetical protein A4S08_04050 [Proteobacteria bacterium SG_bin4]|nr:MAG: hypothetical protein A4S08_04050 [Proteobacteria bacterium SG_bin4]